MRSSIRRGTVVGGVAIWVLAAGAIGCGGAAQNAYRSAMAKQEQCCDRLADSSAATACRDTIPRVDTPAAETSDVNQETFGCVSLFECDASTGRRPSLRKRARPSRTSGRPVATVAVRVSSRRLTRDGSVCVPAATRPGGGGESGDAGSGKAV